MDSVAAWSNASDALLGGAPRLFSDIAPVVSNSGDIEAAARWFLNKTADWLKGQKQAHGPLDAFDFAIWDVEALEHIWGGFRLIAADLGDDLAAVGVFMLQRLPTVWTRPSGRRDAGPVAVALQLADKIDTLVGMFHVGETPTGSKDPFALRRAGLAIWSGISAPTVADFRSVTPTTKGPK